MAYNFLKYKNYPMAKQKRRLKKYQQKPKKWFKGLSWQKKALVSVVLAAAMVGVGFLTPIVPRPTNNEPGPSAEQKALRDAEVKRVVQDGKIRDQAADALKKGDIAKADDVYQSAVNAEKDPARKVQLSIDYSEIFYASGQFVKAIEVAQKAEPFNSDKFLIADWLSRLYEDQRNFDKAIEYYELAAKWADSPTNKARLSEAYYKSQVDRMLVLEHVQ